MEPDLYIVVDTQSQWIPYIWCARDAHECHDHINDALDRGLEEAANWVVRPAKLIVDAETPSV